MVCDTSLVWGFAHPGLQSRAHPAVEEISAEFGFGAAGTNPGAQWENSHWLQKFHPDANLVVPGASWKEFGDASAEQGVVSPPHSLIQM